MERTSVFDPGRECRPRSRHGTHGSVSDHLNRICPRAKGTKKKKRKPVAAITGRRAGNFYARTTVGRKSAADFGRRVIKKNRSSALLISSNDYFPFPRAQLPRSIDARSLSYSRPARTPGGGDHLFRRVPPDKDGEWPPTFVSLSH